MRNFNRDQFALAMGWGRQHNDAMQEELIECLNLVVAQVQQSS
jgi:hypothetical protein